jgi:hypothetical protein
MSGNPLMQLLDADLNSDLNRAICRFFLHRIATAIRYVFPARATAIKRIRENSRLLREQGLTQADLAELFDYLVQTGAIEWLASDQRAFRYLGGL